MKLCRGVCGMRRAASLVCEGLPRCVRGCRLAVHCRVLAGGVAGRGKSVRLKIAGTHPPPALPPFRVVRGSVFVHEKRRKYPMLGSVEPAADPACADHPKVSLFRCERLVLKAMPPQPLNVDGEVRGSTPVTIGVLSRSLQVLVR